MGRIVADSGHISRCSSLAIKNRMQQYCLIDTRVIDLAAFANRKIDEGRSLICAIITFVDNLAIRSIMNAASMRKI